MGIKRRKARKRAGEGRSSPGAAKNGGRVPILDQWVEVRVRDGQTVTELYPPNMELIERQTEMDPAPELVYRRIFFIGAIPSEYYWATEDEKRRQFGGCGLQRMTVEMWLKQIDIEADRGGGHLLDTPELMPRPQEHGPCDCDACKEAERRLEEGADLLQEPTVRS